MTIAKELQERLALAGIPVVGISVGVAGKPKTDKSAWQVSYAPGATQADAEKAAAVIAAFDPTTIRDPKRRSFAVALERITVGEYAALVAAKNANPSIGLLYDRAIAQDIIDLNAQDTMDAFALMVSEGLFTEARLNELFKA